MPRIKKKFSNWELPDWDNDIVEIADEYTQNEKQIIVLKCDDKYYHIRRPKHKIWDMAEVGMKFRVTKVMRNAKNARIYIQSWLHNNFSK